MKTVPVPQLKPDETTILAVSGFPPPWRFVIVTRQGDQHLAYWNLCRHLPVPLDGGSGSLEGKLWVCTTHGATFEPSTGLCTAGPCQGESLYPLEVLRIGEQWVIRLEVPLS